MTRFLAPAYVRQLSCSQGAGAMRGRFRACRRWTLTTLALASLLGGCVYARYPGYDSPYDSGGVVAYGGGWGWHGGWHDRDWHENEWHGRSWH